MTKKISKNGMLSINPYLIFGFYVILEMIILKVNAFSITHKLKKEIKKIVAKSYILEDFQKIGTWKYRFLAQYTVSARVQPHS